MREQTDNEFACDLETTEGNGDKVIESYFENWAKERDVEKESKEKIWLGPDNDDDECNNCNENVYEGSVRKKPKLDRGTMRMLINLTSDQLCVFSPSHVGNFDLPLLLATQEIIHRVVQMLREKKNQTLKLPSDGSVISMCKKHQCALTEKVIMVVTMIS